MPIFIPVFIFTFEILFFLFASHDLDRSVREAAREMKIGMETRNAIGAVCAQSVVPDCDDRLLAEIRTFTVEGELSGARIFPPARSTIAMLKAEMPVPATFFISSLQGRPLTVSSAYLFKTEPF